MPDQQLAVLCQFQVFFVVIAGSVLQENPNSPAIDLVLTWMLMLIIVFAFFIDFMDGNSISETIRMIAGEDDLEYLQRLKLQVRKPPLPFLLTTTLPDTHTPYAISHDVNTFN